MPAPKKNTPMVPAAAKTKMPRYAAPPPSPMLEAQPKMTNKPAGPTPQVKAQRLAKEKDAIAARARKKGLNPSKADIEATYKRNRKRITAARRAAAKKGT